MRTKRLLVLGIVATLLTAPLRAGPAAAEDAKGEFHFTVEGDWPVAELSGDSAWVYDMAGFFHIGLDGKDGERWVILDINKNGKERPTVGTHRLGMGISSYRATLEIYNDDDSTVLFNGGEFEITSANDNGMEGRFELTSSGVIGPKLTVRGTFKANERKMN